MKNKIIGNIKLYPKNTKKKIMTLFLIGTIISTSLPGCSKDKTCNIKEDHYHIYKNKNGKLTFPTKWKTVSKKTFSNYEGIGRTGTEIEYKTYKISKENNIYKKEKVTSKDLEQGTYIDINDFVILQDAEQSYYVKGKKL